MAKKHKHPEHVNHERWLVSYADFITLLFAFFVVLFSSAQVDAESSATLSISMEQAFNQFSIFKYQSGTSDDQASKGGKKGNAYHYDKFKEKGTERQIPTLLPREISQMGEFNLVEDSTGKKLSETEMVKTDDGIASAQLQLQELIASNKLNADVNIKSDSRGLVMSIRDAALFPPGSATIYQTTLDWLGDLAKIIKSQEGVVRIEGHTSSVTPEPPYSNYWELSSARSVGLADVLINKYALDPKRLLPLGYGAYRPLEMNLPDDEKYKNDRVDFVILAE